MLALKAENISKQYRLGQVGTGTLSHDLNRFWHKIRGKEDPYLKIGEANDRTSKGESEYVWSLRDINFEIEQGDAVGIIGRNGAGKSTLLKLLSKVTKPTTGKIYTRGRIASLLEVGTGFHPEMTGRENVFLNGAILGMTRKEITRKFDEIVDFSGVERYIDTPVKRYSSGMYVRLAFAVAAHLESEILIVDEVLAVGDAEFQKKCLGKMGDVSKGEGRTVLFVSHNMAAVRELCNNGIYLNQGQVSHVGNINDCIGLYNGNLEFKNVWNGKIENEYFDILCTRIFNETNTQLTNSDKIYINIDIDIKQSLPNLGIGFYIKSNFDDNIVRNFYNDYNDLKTLPVGKHTVKFEMPSYFLAEGVYKILFDISIPKRKEYSKGQCDLMFDVSSVNRTGNVYLNSQFPTFGSIVRYNLFAGVDTHP
ncbi:MAG: polysaccharide ABC transporter ATP-binding protein [Bergeyella sp.]